jgi:hypothetical protein
VLGLPNGGNKTLAEKHPYSPGGAGAITAAIRQFRNALPARITADTLKKLGIAPNNESYVINILRFLGVIDPDGNRRQEALTTFSKDDSEFQTEFGKMIEGAYQELFGLHHEKTWELPESKLVSFFRTTDQTSALTGRRQANTFQTLASLAGHGQAPSGPKAKQIKEAKPRNGKGKETTLIQTAIASDKARDFNDRQSKREIGLTVRIEVNLPVAGEQETYDRIFRSIRENLLNAK